ncbi:hypothetical protein [Arachnia propionica]|uniref:hypothetical protein n=1 Tax=Arachnia propionica TaxID=1750 RepID=UPI003C7052E5
MAASMAVRTHAERVVQYPAVASAAIAASTAARAWAPMVKLRGCPEGWVTGWSARC